MIAVAPTTRILVYTGATDMRKGFCGLSGIVKEHFNVDLFSGHLFVFLNRKLIGVYTFISVLCSEFNGEALLRAYLYRGDRNPQG